VYAPWIIAFLEGFSTLAVEVIAIRLAIPVVGSSITLTGVMLGIVLLALSAGYWRGGVLSARWDTAQTRSRLARNLVLAAILYGAVAFPFEASLLERLLDTGLGLPMAIGVTATVLLLLPIYLASQTVPMLAELTNIDGHAGKASGKVLFYSTLGSVAGGIITPVWLFPSIGVSRSGYLVCAVLAGAAIVIGIARAKALTAGAAALAIGVIYVPRNEIFAFDSAYQSIRIVEAPAENGRIERAFLMGGGRASAIYADNGETSVQYVIESEKMLAEIKPETVLVIGAAGFTFPRDIAASVKQIDAVDVDPSVQRIAEEHFLKQPLPSNVRFLPLSARYAVRKLRKEGRYYGFTMVDAYFGKGLPEELATVEFFRDVRLVSQRVLVNVIMDRAMDSAFARNLLATFREAFGAVWFKDAKPGDSDLTNILVTSWPALGSAPWNGTGTVYRDQKNTADRDHVALIW
jgi:spermidine synthase